MAYWYQIVKIFHIIYTCIVYCTYAIMDNGARYLNATALLVLFAFTSTTAVYAADIVPEIIIDN